MCDPILVTLLKMRPHDSQSSHENTTPSTGTSPLGSYEEVPPRLSGKLLLWTPFLFHILKVSTYENFHFIRST